MSRTNRFSSDDVEDEPSADEPAAATAGEQDHSDPHRFTGEPADPPDDTGRPPEDT